MASVRKGLVAIASEVLDDAKKEAEKLIRNAEQKGKEILRKAKEEAEKMRAELLAQAKRKGQEEKRKARSLTEVETRNRLLEVEEELINVAFDKAFIHLNEFVQTESYHDCLLQLISEAVNKIGSDTLIVCVNSKDREFMSQGGLDKLSEQLGVKLVLANETENCIGGSIVRTSDGTMSYDNTLESRFKRLKPVLRIRIAKMLFGKGA